MAAPKKVHDKLIPLLEAHQPQAPGPELAYALTVLGPQEHNCKRYEAVTGLGEPVKAVPLDKDGVFVPGLVQVRVTELPRPRKGEEK